MFSEPVVGEKFFGREEVLDLLSKRALALKDGYRQNVALTGQSLAGKSSILHHFLYSIKEEDFITIYVEVIKEPFKSFSNRFIATLLYNALGKMGEDCPLDADGLLDRAEKSLPKTYAAIRHINSLIEKSDCDEAYSSLLGLTSTLKDEIKRSCVVILDEFDNLEYIGVKNPFLNFGKVIMIQKDTMYIVSSSRNQVFKKILSEKLSLLFGNFEIIKISGFGADSAGKFIEMRLSGFEIDDIIKKFLIVFTDANPFYLNQIVKKAKEIAADKMSNYIDKEVIAHAIADIVYSANGVIHQYLLNYILDLIDTRHKEKYMSILVSIANGRNKLPDISKSLKKKQSEISKDLLELSELGFISKGGVFYRVDDSVLEFWLKHVYQKRREMLVDGIFNRLELFGSEVRSYITEFVNESERGIIAKVSELFNSFSNELVLIDSKNLRLPHFTKVETKLSRDLKQFIAATFRGNTWIAQPYEDTVGENNIIDYVRNIKSIGYKISNKIIIPLKGIEENAKLLAKELKISIWDIATFNNLLSTYSKKKVVI